MSAKIFYSDQGPVLVIKRRNKPLIIKGISSDSPIYHINEVEIYEEIPDYEEFLTMKSQRSLNKKLISRQKYLKTEVYNKSRSELISMIHYLNLELLKEKEKSEMLEQKYQQRTASYSSYLNSVFINANKRGIK